MWSPPARRYRCLYETSKNRDLCPPKMEIREALNRAGPGRSWPVLAGPGRSWPVLAGPRLLVFRKKSAPHPQLVSLTEMRTKGRKPLSVLRLKIFEKVFSENYETLFFRGPARTGQDRPGPARTGQDRPSSVSPLLRNQPLFCRS